MSFNRIKAILLQEYYITINSLEVILDLPFYALMSVIVFGYFSVFLLGTGHVQKSAAYFILLGTLLWEIIHIAQYSVSLGSMWNIWSKNLSNMFIAPLSIAEYIFAEIFSGAIKALIIFIGISLIAIVLFHFNIFSLGFINLLLFFINLNIFAWSLGLVVLGIVFRFGTRIQAITWGVVLFFQPLTAAYFPVRILPKFLQIIAYLLPPTYVFEAARDALTNPAVNWKFFGISFGENIFYFLVALFIFSKLFNKSKDTGQFARNES